MNIQRATNKNVPTTNFFETDFRNLEFEKQTDQNFITQNLRAGKEYCILKKKKLLKQCQMQVIYEYILAFAGWWFYFGWWWTYFG